MFLKHLNHETEQSSEENRNENCIVRPDGVTMTWMRALCF